MEALGTIAVLEKQKQGGGLTRLYFRIITWAVSGWRVRWWICWKYRDQLETRMQAKINQSIDQLKNTSSEAVAVEWKRGD